MDLGLGDIGLIALAVVGALLALPLIVGAIFVIIVVSNRADPDPSGRRPAVVYSYAVAFITLFVSVLASEIVVLQLCSLIGSHHTAPASSDFGSSDFGSSGDLLGLPSTMMVPAGPKHDFGNGVARGVVMAGLLLLVAYAMYAAHVRVADRATAGLSAVEPAGRVRASYLAAVSFVSVMIIVISLVGGTYQIFRVIAPGVFNSGGHGSHLTPLRTLIPLAYLAYLGYRLLRRHVGQLPPEFRPNFGSWTSPTTPAAPAPAAQTEVIETIEVEVMDAGPAPRPARKRAPRKPPEG